MGSQKKLLLTYEIIEKIKKHGLFCFSKLCILLTYRFIFRKYCLFISRTAERYKDPNADELCIIEGDLLALGVRVENYEPEPSQFHSFLEQQWFPPDYHGGLESGVWDEKLLEHWISSELLGLHEFDPADIYVDVAAASSPWAKILRDRLGINAFAIDLCDIPDEYS